MKNLRPAHIVRLPGDHSTYSNGFTVKNDLLAAAFTDLFYLIDLKNGQLKWAKSLMGRHMHIVRPVIGENVVVVCDVDTKGKETGWIFGLEIATGSLRWKHPMPARPITTNIDPIWGENGKLFVLCNEAHAFSDDKKPQFFQVIDIESGEILHDFKTGIPKVFSTSIQGLLGNELVIYDKSHPLISLDFSREALKTHRLMEEDQFIPPHIPTQSHIQATYNQTDKTYRFFRISLPSGEILAELQVKDKANFPKAVHYLANGNISLEYTFSDEEQTVIRGYDGRDGKLLWEEIFDERDDIPGNRVVSQVVALKSWLLVKYSVNYARRWGWFNESGEFHEGGKELFDFLFPADGYCIRYSSRNMMNEVAIFDPENAGGESLELDLSKVDFRPAPMRDLLAGTTQSPLQKALDDLEKAVVTAQKDPKKLGNLYKKMQRIFNCGPLAADTKAYIEATINTEKLPGPLFFDGFSAAVKTAETFDKLMGVGPDDQLFPGLLVASETYGQYFYLMLETGRVVSAHHDSLFPEYGSDAWRKAVKKVKKDKKPAAFCRYMEDYYSGFSITDLMAWQTEFSAVDRIEDLKKSVGKKEIIKSIRTHFMGGDMRAAYKAHLLKYVYGEFLARIVG